MLRQDILGGMLVLLGTGCATVAPSAPTRLASEVEFVDFAPAAFERAAQEDKLVYLDVGMEGCTACRWMEEGTYSDPEVRRLLNQHFIAIEVDAEARPDVGERFSAWAWPALVFLRPNGELVHAIRGNSRPRNFLPVLRSLVTAHQDGDLDDAFEPPEVLAGPVEETSGAWQAALGTWDGRFDEEAGGWGRMKRPYGALLELAWLRASHYREDVWAARARKTAEGMGALLDPVAGGVFVASMGGWERPILEKRIAGQARAMQSFARAYQRSGDERFARSAREVHRYLIAEAMYDAERGLFYTSQRDHSQRWPAGMDAVAYYALDAAGRAAVSPPDTDHAIYTDKNALVVRAYLALYEATGDPEYLRVARRTVDSLLALRSDQEGWLVQLVTHEAIATDARLRDTPASEQRMYLRTQALAALALLDLFQATAEVTYLERAEVLFAHLAALRDEGSRLYRGSDDPAPAPGLNAWISAEDNAWAAELSWRLGSFSDQPELAKEAHLILEALAKTKPESAQEPVVLAIRQLVRFSPLELSIAATSSDPGAQALHRAALAVADGRKIVKYDRAEKYPRQEQAAVYICDVSSCSPPVTSPDELAGVAARFRGTGKF